MDNIQQHFYRDIPKYGLREYGREELKCPPESVIIDATNKTNSHRMVLPNIIASNMIAFEYCQNQLAITLVTGC
ncbi:hypothetical protein A0J61_08633 [Choanephora cucurbitarum]|uniref:Uncharacterized protein n=1 Tax=Choanephora cucurbitarum TaxID=101091 RepID=A0A1C7N3T5_9FUNG|nr:hypothetical protein A0J61_08633 [Choanephora cucurbitarum]